MKAMIPRGLKPVASGNPVRPVVPRVRHEMQDSDTIGWHPSFGPRGFGSGTMRSMIPQHLEFNPRLRDMQQGR